MSNEIAVWISILHNLHRERNIEVMGGNMWEYVCVREREINYVNKRWLCMN